MASSDQYWDAPFWPLVYVYALAVDSDALILLST